MRKQKHSERERDNEHTWDGEAVIYIENNAGLITPVSMGKHPLIRWFALHHCQHTHCHTLKQSQLSTQSHEVPIATNSFPWPELDCHPYTNLCLIST